MWANKGGRVTSTKISGFIINIKNQQDYTNGLQAVKTLSILKSTVWPMYSSMEYQLPTIPVFCSAPAW